MTWWQVLLVFVGIPVAMFVVITVVVFRFTTARVPDGLLGAAEQDDEEEPPPEAHDGGPEDDTQDE